MASDTPQTTELHVLLQRPDVTVEQVLLLCQQQPSLVDEPDEKSFTPLHTAAHQGHDAVVT